MLIGDWARGTRLLFTEKMYRPATVTPKGRIGTMRVQIPKGSE